MAAENGIRLADSVNAWKLRRVSDWACGRMARCGWRRFGVLTQLRRSPHALLSRSALSQVAGSPSPYMEILPEVAEAVAAGHPVVAMETSLVTHGMPLPENLRVAQELEAIAREEGVVPATVGVLEGKVHVGLSPTQLSLLATSASSGHAHKISRRDLSYTLSKGLSGGTTVAATMWCAHRAGIPLFITGGLGGVHREGERTLDISADLMELGRTPVAVVCAGIKSILDVPRTLEVLETQGVAVATYGDSLEFPAFFTASSGHKSPFNVQSAAEAARLIDTSLNIGMESGLVLAVPIPAQFSAQGKEIERFIEEAISEAKSLGLRGEYLTPYLLQSLNEKTAGKSLLANIALLRNNVTIGCRIATELAKIRNNCSVSVAGGNCGAPPTAMPHATPPLHSKTEQNDGTGRPKVWQKETTPFVTRTYAHTHKTPVVIGASVLDLVVKVTTPEIKSEGTNPGSVHHAFGGVGRNVAECLARMGTFPFLISALGSDHSGSLLSTHSMNCGMSLLGTFQSPSLPTASYCVVLDNEGELFCGVGDMEINSTITVEWVQRFSSKLKSASVVCVDGNLPHETVCYVCEQCAKFEVPVWFEPTCIQKAQVPSIIGVLSKLTYTSPNLSELRSMVWAQGNRTKTTTETRNGIKTASEALNGSEAAISTQSGMGSDREYIKKLSLEQKLSECKELIPQLVAHVPHVFVTLGADGVVWGTRDGPLLHFPTPDHPTLPHVVNVTGAGDSFVAGVISCLTRGINIEAAIKAGLRAASLSVCSQNAVSPKVTPSLFAERRVQEWAPWKPREL